MSLIHEESHECSLSPLEWFTLQPTQTAVEKTYDVEYQSLTSLRNNAPVEFYIPATTADLTDLKNSKLYIAFRIVNADGTVCQATDIVAPVNDIFNSMWSNVELFMGDRLVSHSNNTHGYTSIISHLIHDSEESLLSERSLRLIYKDTAGQMDQTDASLSNAFESIPGFHNAEKRLVRQGDGTVEAEDITNPGNAGLHKRFLFTKASKKVGLLGSLRIDMFEQEKYIPNGISIKLRFHRQREPFTLMTGGGNDAFKIELLEAYLLVRHVKVSPGVVLGHEEGLRLKPAQFPITRKESKVIAVSAGVTTFVKDNIFLGQLPKRVVVGIVGTQGYSGDARHNPFNFAHGHVNYMQLYTDGEPVLSKPLRPNFNDEDYLHCYNTLYRGFDKVHGLKSTIIKREEFDKGYALFAFDLTPDYDDDDHFPLIKHGNLRLEITFAQALNTPINIIIYAEFDNIVEITASRKVQMDYT